jgi:SNF2 family DNA or RNA helicase
MEQVKNTQVEGLEGIERRNVILKALWALRDISDHPCIIQKNHADFTSSELVNDSAKLKVLVKILEQVKAKNEKVIVFADRRETQKILQRVVSELFQLPMPSIINGDTPSTQQRESSSKLSRQQTIDRFKQTLGFNVIIMSQLAAGVGLNVICANHVVHYSRHWNPAKEDQATDRAYRIGQDKPVSVYYPRSIFPETMLSVNEDTKELSFDEVLHNLLERKRSLASATLFPSEQCDIAVEELYGSLLKVNSKVNIDNGSMVF